MPSFDKFDISGEWELTGMSCWNHNVYYASVAHKNSENLNFRFKYNYLLRVPCMLQRHFLLRFQLLYPFQAPPTLSPRQHRFPDISLQPARLRRFLPTCGFWRENDAVHFYSAVAGCVFDGHR